MARRSDHTRDELSRMILEETCQLIRSEGIVALSARKVAARVGYTVGTIYQHFDNMDHLVEAANMQTLAALLNDCRTVELRGSPREQLFSLAGAFIDFVDTYPNEWDAVISYRYGPDHAWSDAYDEQVEMLLGLMARATQSLYPEYGSQDHAHDMRVLWAGMYGMFSLDTSNRLGRHVTLERMILSLIDMYISAMQDRRDDRD